MLAEMKHSHGCRVWQPRRDGQTGAADDVGQAMKGSQAARGGAPSPRTEHALERTPSCKQTRTLFLASPRVKAVSPREAVGMKSGTGMYRNQQLGFDPSDGRGSMVSRVWRLGQ